MREKIKFDIVKSKNIFFAVSIAIVLIGSILMAMLGFNWGIDFTGGTTLHFDLNKPVTDSDIKDLRDAVEGVIGVAPSTQKTGDTGSEIIVKISIQDSSNELDIEKRDAILNAVKEKFSITDNEVLSVDTVSAAVGNDIKSAAIWASLIAIVLMLLYITFRFEFLSGVSAVIALIHDIFIMLTAYCLFRVQMNLTFIAAALTILGYSINATIIVFDRIRENNRNIKNAKKDFDEVVNASVWETFNRCVFTTLTTLIMVVILYILGVPAIKDFAFPLIVGILAGFYSSVFLSGSVWATLKKATSKKPVTAKSK